MRLIILIIAGLIGAYIFSLLGKKENKNTNRSQNDFWEKYNNPTYKMNTRYNNHCWNCGKKIDSFYEKKCNVCGWYICSSCGACSNKPNCEEKEINQRKER